MEPTVYSEDDLVCKGRQILSLNNWQKSPIKDRRQVSVSSGNVTTGRKVSRGEAVYSVPTMIY